MPIISDPELTQRDRIYLIVHAEGQPPPHSMLAKPLLQQTIRSVDVRSELLKLMGQSIGRQISADDVLTMIRDNLTQRGIVIFVNFALPLAFFGDVSRVDLWKRVLTEILDRPALGVLLLPETSKLLPPPQLIERYQHLIRRYPIDNVYTPLDAT